MSKTITEVTETERFDADGYLIEKTKVTVTRTETDNNDYSWTPYKPYPPYVVSWDTEKQPYLYN